VDATPTAKVGWVRDWMTRNPVTVSPELSIEQVIRLMRAHGIRHVLVTDDERLVGIVSNRDLRRLVVGDGPPFSPRLPAGRIMTESPVTVSPETSLIEAAREMLDRKIGALPVVEENRLIGILTKSDAFEALLAWAER